MEKDTLISQVIEQNEGNEYYKNFKFNYSDRILREHNQEVYEKIVKGLVTGNKVLFEQATGTGKSYLALKFLHDHAQGKRVLFVSPANAIKESFTDLCNKWLGEDYCKFDTCLYQGLKGKQNKHYDIIIFDEVHRMGAKTWGPNAEILMNNNPNASILGMTATLDRPDCVDVRQYFDNREPVSRITLVEALEKGILPKPDYTLAKVDFEDDVQYIDTCINDFKEKLKQAEGEEKKQILDFLERLKKAKQTIAESEDIPQIFANEITTKELKQGKFIVFCPAGEDEDENKESIHRMKTIMKQAPKWFEGVEGIKKIKKYSVYSKLDAKKNSKIIDAFDRDDTKALKLLFSINMLNEGLHVDDIDGVIMLRSTGSRIIYLQQLGRALSVGHKRQPKIFDFVANLNYVDVTAMQQMTTDINKGNDEGGHGGEDVDTAENDLRFKLNIDNLDTLQLIDTLKSNIFAFNHKNDFEFEDFYNRLLVYKNEFGDCVVPKEYNCKDGYPLGQKVSNIRVGGIKLNEEERDILTDIEFVWIALGLDVDNVRVRLKKFVENFNTFVTQYGRNPKGTPVEGTEREKEYERKLYNRWIHYRDFENLENEYEEKYLQNNLIQLEENTIRESIKKFAQNYKAFVEKYGEKPRKAGKREKESSLRVLWQTYADPKKSSEDEINYLRSEGIEILEKIEIVGNIRPSIRKFVDEYKEFINKHNREPKNKGQEENESSLYDRWRQYGNPKKSNGDEINYLKSEGIRIIEVVEITDNIRPALKKFASEYKEFINKHNREPKFKGKEENESSLYDRWGEYTNPLNLKNEEKGYLIGCGIAVREELDTSNNVRPSVKKFVRDYKVFLDKYGREPKSVVKPKTQEKKDEQSLYRKLIIYRQVKNLENEYEIKYLQSNGIEVIGLEEMQEVETKPSGENFEQ